MEKPTIKLIEKFFELLERIDERLNRLELLEKERIDNTNKKDNRIIPLSKWNDYHDWPTIGSLRHIVFYKHKNGANKFLRYTGRRVLICEKSFFEWVKDNNNDI